MYLSGKKNNWQGKREREMGLVIQIVSTHRAAIDDAHGAILNM
jgi:hypothetical protein